MEIHREKFNGVDLFTSNAGDGMNSEGSRFSYTLVTHDSGQVEDGSVSNVVNLQTSSGWWPDARFHSAFNGTSQAVALISAMGWGQCYQLHNGRPATPKYFYLRWLFEQSTQYLNRPADQCLETLQIRGEWCGAKPPYDGGRITFFKND